MFDWFKSKKYEVPSNVVPFPELAKDPTVPEVQRPKEKPAHTFYRLGITDNNRVSLQMGYSEITMNKDGVQNLIDQLTVFMNQLSDYDDDDAS